MTTTLTKTDELTTLAESVNEHHRECELAARSAIGHAKVAGELLIEAKGRVSHGEWLPWLEGNVECSQRTSQGYMKVAREWKRLESKTQRVADLSLRDGLRLLSEQPPEPGGSEADMREVMRLIDGVKSMDISQLNLADCIQAISACEDLQRSISLAEFQLHCAEGKSVVVSGKRKRRFVVVPSTATQSPDIAIDDQSGLERALAAEARIDAALQREIDAAIEIAETSGESIIDVLSITLADDPGILQMVKHRMLREWEPVGAAVEAAEGN
jgi:hypothetical protein